MLHMRSALTLIVTLGTSVPVSGSAAAPEGPLTLGRAVALALERNNELRLLANQVALGRTGVAEARARTHPDLTLGVSPAERLNDTFDEGLTLHASSGLTLYNGAADRAALEAARLDLEASEQTLAQARQRLGYETATRFLRAFATEEMVGVQQESLTAQRQQLERIRAYWQQGMRSRADVLLQEAALASTEVGLVNAQQSHELALLQVNEVLQIDLSTHLDLVRPPFDDQRAGPSDVDPAQVTREAMASRADLESQRVRIAAAEQGVRQARAGRMPVLSLSTSGSTSYSSLDQRAGFASQLFDRNPSASVGLSLSFSPFDRRQTKSAISRAEVALESEQLTLQTQEQDLAMAVQRAVLDHRAAWQRLAAAEAQKASASEALAAMAARYDAGSAAFVELSQARAQNVDAQGTWVESVYDVTLTRLAVAYQRGGDAWNAALATLTGAPEP